MRIGILTPSLTSGDAVSNDVLGMYQALLRVGEVRIFAEGSSVESPAIFFCKKIDSFLTKRDDLLIYHFSRGWEPAVEFLRQLTCRKIVKYHNITPADFFTPYNPNLAGVSIAGRREIKGVVAACDVFVGASDYNRRELIAEGANESKCFVVPPFHRAHTLQSICASGPAESNHQDGNVSVCTVGRIAPHKAHVQLLAAFAVYHHDYNRHSTLTIVGKRETRLANYTAVLQAVAKRLNIEHAITFTGEVSEAALKAHYNASDIFITTSEHEGFCVPLVEAMALEIPIVAYHTPAISETVGRAGVVWKQRNPCLMAESINSVVANYTLQSTLTEAGRRRYDERFAPERIQAKLLEVLNHV